MDEKRIVEYVESLKINEKKCVVNNIMEIKEFEEIKIETLKDRTRAFVKVQDGCNQYCTYCIIPYARGNIRSRKLENVLEEVNKLVENGFKEIVLTGIHIASYGKDLGNISLIELIEEVAKVKGLKRLRMSSVEPRLFTDEFIERLKKIDVFCPHFHMSLQSGSDSVLKRMNRKYTTTEYYETYQKIHSSFKNSAITTDVIVGFPSETDEEFLETKEFVKKIGFSQVHVFQYSPKKGTKAYDMKDQVLNKIKHLRSEELIKIANELQTEFKLKMIDKELSVLFEGIYEKNSKYIEGGSENYLRVIVEGDLSLKGKIKKVKIIKLENDILFGKII